ncbi:hypothetical protein [Qipengyuania sp. JC766]|uniref:hypothetical protein n=1 Tax=Qipengyuania sp. JC766 TaxID=3232139 RepID=UPI003458EC22
MRTLALSLAATAFGLTGASALAQETTEAVPDNVQTAIVYGEDDAPPCPEGVICVIARMPESERYRIPPVLRLSEDPSNMAWTRRVERLEIIGDSGIQSCSPVGAGGETGCTQQLIAAAYGERENSNSVRFGQLINEAREERLSEIDSEAAAEQQRVEELERQYMERLEAERDGPVPGSETDASGEPVAVDPDDLPDPQGL